MTKKKLIELAYEEAQKLHENTTEDEKIRLAKVEWIKPVSTVSCIYGVLSLHCYNDRAQELIKLCASKVIRLTKNIVPNLKLKDMVTYDKIFNEFSKEPLRSDYNSIYTPLEVLIIKDTSHIISIIEIIIGKDLAKMFGAHLIKIKK